MRARAAYSAGFLFITVMLSVYVQSARAEVILSAGITETYEDNASGLVTKAGGVKGGGGLKNTRTADTATAITRNPVQRYGAPQSGGAGSGENAGKSDFSTTINAAVGYSAPEDGLPGFFVFGYADTTRFVRLGKYDTVGAGVSTGIQLFSLSWMTAAIAVDAGARRYENDRPRNSTSSAGGFSLSHELTDELTLSEGFDYEKSRADAIVNSYRGSVYTVGLGYDVTDSLSLNAGYDLSERTADAPGGACTRITTVLAGLSCDVSDDWSADAVYEHQVTGVSTSAIKANNNIISFGVRYTF